MGMMGEAHAAHAMHAVCVAVTLCTSCIQVFYTLHRRWTTRRPMSEFLGAIGENDEPGV